mmetsp:Transcript_125255/g.348514  ORF Transcript_125255/g.348514 Transcript_125255/m.348514 type:complete len:325 (-) Transcript_125255:28-1002(-)
MVATRKLNPLPHCHGVVDLAVNALGHLRVPIIARNWFFKRRLVLRTTEADRALLTWGCTAAWDLGEQVPGFGRSSSREDAPKLLDQWLRLHEAHIRDDRNARCEALQRHHLEGLDVQSRAGLRRPEGHHQAPAPAEHDEAAEGPQVLQQHPTDVAKVAAHQAPEDHEPRPRHLEPRQFAEEQKPITERPPALLAAAGRQGRSAVGDHHSHEARAKTQEECRKENVAADLADEALSPGTAYRFAPRRGRAHHAQHEALHERVRPWDGCLAHCTSGLATAGVLSCALGLRGLQELLSLALEVDKCRRCHPERASTAARPPSLQSLW